MENMGLISENDNMFEMTPMGHTSVEPGENYGDGQAVASTDLPGFEEVCGMGIYVLLERARGMLINYAMSSTDLTIYTPGRVVVARQTGRPGNFSFTAGDWAFLNSLGMFAVQPGDFAAVPLVDSGAGQSSYSPANTAGNTAAPNDPVDTAVSDILDTGLIS